MTGRGVIKRGLKGAQLYYVIIVDISASPYKNDKNRITALQYSIDVVDKDLQVI